MSVLRQSRRYEGQAGSGRGTDGWRSSDVGRMRGRPSRWRSPPQLADLHDVERARRWHHRRLPRCRSRAAPSPCMTIGITRQHSAKTLRDPPVSRDEVGLHNPAPNQARTIPGVDVRALNAGHSAHSPAQLGRGARDRHHRGPGQRAEMPRPSPRARSQSGTAPSSPKPRRTVRRRIQLSRSGQSLTRLRPAGILRHGTPFRYAAQAVASSRGETA